MGPPARVAMAAIGAALCVAAYVLGAVAVATGAASALAAGAVAVVGFGVGLVLLAMAANGRRG